MKTPQQYAAFYGYKLGRVIVDLPDGFLDRFYSKVIRQNNRSLPKDMFKWLATIKLSKQYRDVLFKGADLTMTLLMMKVSNVSPCDVLVDIIEKNDDVSRLLKTHRYIDTCYAAVFLNLMTDLFLIYTLKPIKSFYETVKDDFSENLEVKDWETKSVRLSRVEQETYKERITNEYSIKKYILVYYDLLSENILDVNLPF